MSELLPLPVYFAVIMMVTMFGGFLFRLAKKFISKPRIGKVKYGKKRKRRKITVVLVNIIYIIVLFVMLFVLNSDLVDIDLIPFMGRCDPLLRFIWASLGSVN